MPSSTILALIVAGSTAQFDAAFLQSLPRLEGRVVMAELDAPVTVRRDGLGIPVIEGESISDIVRTQGYLHGQERFFQMDLMRRRAAGRLSALLGPPTIGADRAMRRYRLEQVADALVPELPPRHRSRLAAYADGVNAGLEDLGAVPPEYHVIGATPEPWRERDAVLVMLAMFDVLHMNARFEKQLGVAYAALPSELVEFLTPDTDRFAAPLVGGSSRDGYRPLPVPGPDIVDLRRPPWSDTPRGDARLSITPPLVPGSNGWAVSGRLGREGQALLANDPHLPLTVPNIWYRVQMQWSGRRLAGVSLPGVPGVIIGSNGDIAWGFTNTTGDFQDLVVVEVDPDDPSRYRSPDGFEPFETLTEVIEVRGSEPRTLTLQRTRWGIVTDRDWKGRPLVLKWTALQPGTINMTILDIGLAKTLEQGIDVARGWWGPSQNVMIADRNGRIAWVVSGYLPKRVGFDGKAPRSWLPDDVGWDGALPESQRPVLLDPPEGLIFTANQRTLPPEQARVIGRAWAPPVRAHRIRDRLSERDRFDAETLLDIQLDTRSPSHDFYRDLAAHVTADATEADLVEAGAVIARWDGRADTDAIGLPLLEILRRELVRRVIDPLVTPCEQLDAGFRYFWLLVDEPVRRILEERPAHLLPPESADWDTLIAEALRGAIRVVRARAPEGNLDVTWGELNRARINHPLSAAAPAYERLLNMPATPLPGNFDTVRVGGRDFAASMRLVVSPGREESGLLHMPCGQSGHPLSPHYRDGHQAWLDGRPTPLLAGETVHTLTLVPGPPASP